MAIIFAPVPSIRIVRGTVWTDDVQLVDQDSSDPINLVGIVGIVSRVRKTINGSVVLEMSTDNARLVIVDPAEGRIGFRVDTTTSLTLPANSNRAAKYIYDAIIERTPGEYEAGPKGSLIVLPQITRPWGTT